MPMRGRNMRGIGEEEDRWQWKARKLWRNIFILNGANIST